MSERTIATNAKAGKTEFKLPELLAPAGGREQLVAAVNNGADAVYMGGSLFNARMKAENFGSGTGGLSAGDSEMKAAIDYAHQRGIRVYITLNTLIKDNEMAKAFEYACGLYEMGADAVILQDMGLARLIHKYLPDFPMHLSTQGTVYNRSGVEFAAEMGFSRVVPARECSLEEIRRLKCDIKDDNAPGGLSTSGELSPTGGLPSSTEIEVFVHGALCMCYSGQCQMSRLLGGGSARSGNRGLCAQPCRLEYKDDKGRVSYALSPKDICTLDDLPALCEAGVDSFKIEGRLKSPEYVAVVTGIYRKYLDRFGVLRARGGSSDAFEIEPEDRRRLLQIFNRGGFTEGYLHGNPNGKILSGHSPKNQGIPVGKVTAITPVKSGRNSGRKSRGKDGENRWLVDVKLSAGETISMGDGIELSECGNVATFVEKISKNVLRIGDFKTDKKSRINLGETVYKVTDRKLCEDALKQQVMRKSKVCMTFTGQVGKPAKLELITDGRHYDAAADAPVEKALKKPADPARIREQLSKLGDTPYEAAEVEIRVDSEAMIPISIINGLRRQTVDMALSDRCSSREPIAKEIIAKAIDEINENAENAVPGHKDSGLENMSGNVLVPLELFMENRSGNAEKKTGEIPYILNVSKGHLDAYIEEHFEKIKAAVMDCGIVIGNPGWIREFRDAGIRVYGDYGLNVFNRQAGIAFAEAGVDVIEMSDELSSDGWRHSGLRREPEWMERIPLMITEHPLDSDFLIDRKGVKHNVMKWYSGDKFLIF